MKTNNIRDLQEFREIREGKEYDLECLTPYWKGRLDFFLDVHRLGLTDRLTYIETVEMHRIMDYITVEKNEK